MSPSSRRGSGYVALTLARAPMAWLLALVTPSVTVDRRPHRRPWGEHQFELEAGEHEIAVSFPYLFAEHCGPASLIVPVYAGHATLVRYDAPFFMFANGAMQILGTAPI